MNWEEEPLPLGIEEPPAKVEPPKRKTKPKVRWASHKPREPLHCDQCLRIAHELWLKEPFIPSRATLKRTFGEDVSYWCSTHGETAKRQDGYSRGR